MPKKIMIVDDEEDIRELVRVTLEDDNYEMHEAENGKEALIKANEVKPDMVILDLMMPDKWGYAVCEELKRNPETKDTIVLFLTARGSSPSRRMGEFKGGDEYIVKPFNPGELREKVKRLLGLD
jgi:DNA-binding response OmpR family regulator